MSRYPRQPVPPPAGRRAPRALTLVKLPFDRLRVVSKRKGRAFTLVELLVVIGVIALVVAIVLPSLQAVFSAGAGDQARNLVGALLAAARGLAIEKNTHALVHVQLAGDETCWAQVLLRDSDPLSSSFMSFLPAEGYRAQKLPGGMALGEVSDGYVDGNGNYKALGSGAAPNANFTTFNVIFAPDGSVVAQVPDANGNPVVPTIDVTANNPAFAGDAEQRIWNSGAATINEPGVRVMTVFEYKQLKVRTTDAARHEYLNTSGAFLVVSPHTGQLLPSK